MRGEDSQSATANLHGHAAGNGGHRQGTPTVTCVVLSYSAKSSCPHCTAISARPRRRGDRVGACYAQLAADAQVRTSTVSRHYSMAAGVECIADRPLSFWRAPFPPRKLRTRSWPRIWKPYRPGYVGAFSSVFHTVGSVHSNAANSAARTGAARRTAAASPSCRNLRNLAVGRAQNQTSHDHAGRPSARDLP